MDNFELKDQENSAFFLGPTVAFGSGDFWAALTVLPQIHGEGEGQHDGLILTDYERTEIRLLVGIPL